MDDEDVDDLLAGVAVLEGSSQESLTNAAANLAFCDDSNEEERQATAPTSVGCQDTAASSSPTKSTSLTVIEKIEGVFEGVADALLAEQDELAITLKTRTTTGARVFSFALPRDSSSGAVKIKQIRFPGKSAEEAWRFTVVMRILELIHEALRNGVVLSKRDLYYRDPALFGSQGTVDRYVDDIAFTFSVSRSNLNVSAVAKGLVVGAIVFCRRDGATVDAAGDREGILVPNRKEVLSIDMSKVQWILIVEKEATFRSIAASRFGDTVSNRGVLLTGKGYPDIATRALLHFLSTPSPRNGFASPPIYGLADCDPDGLAILSIYKNGSMALSHENADLCVPSLQWLGLRNEHMMVGGDDVHVSQGLLNLTPRDRRKAVKMLGRCIAPDSPNDESELRQALQTMLMFNTKAELQLLDAIPDGMTNLLASALENL